MSAQEPAASENRFAVRASDDERERAIATLREHTADGRLTLEEFDGRLGEVYAAVTVGDVQRALRELPVVRVTPRTPAAPPVTRRSSGEEVAERHRKHNTHVTGFVTLSVLLIAIWVMSGGGYFWPMWAIVPLGIIKIKHVMTE